MIARYSTYSATAWSIITTSSCLALYMKLCYHYMCSNPSTDQYRCFVSDLPSVSLVTQELTAVSEKWQYIGEELGVGQYWLDDISTKHSDPADCLRDVLSKRFECCATTWKHIVDVLRTPRIQESHLADHLEAKYCSSELTYSSVDTMY